MEVLTNLNRELLKDKRFAEAYDEVVREEIGAALRDARESRGLSQDEVARRMDVTRPRVSQIEGAEGHAISIGVLHRFAAALGCRLEINIRDPEHADRDVPLYVLGHAYGGAVRDQQIDAERAHQLVIPLEYTESGHEYSQAA